MERGEGGLKGRGELEGGKISPPHIELLHLKNNFMAAPTHLPGLIRRRAR